MINLIISAPQIVIILVVIGAIVTLIISKNTKLKKIIGVTIVVLVIGGQIIRGQLNKDMDRTILKWSHVQKVNETSGEQVSYSMYEDTFILTVDLEGVAKHKNISYSDAVRHYEITLPSRNQTLASMSQDVINIYKENQLYRELIQKGFKSFQAKVLYRDGTITESEIIELIE